MSQRTKKFSGTSQSRTHFDRKISPHGKGRAVAITKVIPKTWRYVRLEVIKVGKSYRDIRVTCLFEGNNNAQTTAADKKHK